MSAIDEPSAQSLASHTLTYMRRLDRRVDGIEKTMVQIVDLLSRLDLKMDRASRDAREGFLRLERDLNEIRSDAVLSDNRILDRFSETIELSRRANRNDERLDELETALASRPDDQGTRSWPASTTGSTTR